MSLVRRLGAMAAVALTVVGAAPASADDPAPDGTIEGMYLFREGDIEAEWKVSPLCSVTQGPGRIPMNLAVACALKIESDPNEGRGGHYRLTGGRWLVSAPLLAGMKCDDGKWGATRETYEFDAATLSGLHTKSYGAICGKRPGLDRTPFTLTFLRPLDFPTIHYPLHCQDNPVHLCS